MFKSSSLKPRKRYIFFGPESPRGASNYPWGIFYTDKTSNAVLEQEKYEFWRTWIIILVGGAGIWGTTFLGIAWWISLIVLLIAWLNPWSLAIMEIQSRIIQIQYQLSLPGWSSMAHAVIHNTVHGMSKHYWFFHLLKWDDKKIKEEISKRIK